MSSSVFWDLLLLIVGGIVVTQPSLLQNVLSSEGYQRLDSKLHKDGITAWQGSMTPALRRHITVIGEHEKYQKYLAIARPDDEDDDRTAETMSLTELLQIVLRQ